MFFLFMPAAHNYSSPTFLELSRMQHKEKKNESINPIPNTNPIDDNTGKLEKNNIPNPTNVLKPILASVLFTFTYSLSYFVYIIGEILYL